jgi:N-methylhydantoinase A
MGMRVGIDTGGTFTDLVAIDESTQKLFTHKTESTPQSPVVALKQVVQDSGLNITDISNVLIGSTVAINAVLTRTGSKVLLVTTKGIRDVLFIQRINRKYHYNLDWKKPEPLVKRRNIIEINERLNYKGEVIQELEKEALDEMLEKVTEAMKRDAINAIAVATLFSYLNPHHELLICDYLKKYFPDVHVSLSHQVSPIWREYERTSTVVADAYVAPIVGEYVKSAHSAFSEIGINAPLNMVKSNGGIEMLDTVPGRPVQVLLSGLAGGMIAGKYFGNLVCSQSVITLDMGGTSCDIGVVSDRFISFTTDFEIEWGLPVSTPVIDVTTIGAGGGSIGWRDKGGFLRVGPQSAGADPGPACYGKGGTEPTLTDANLLLGRLNPDYFLNGRMRLFNDKAKETIGLLARQISMNLSQTALSMIQIANENMAGQINLLTVDKGLDPRNFSLVAFGGAGPLHATAIAKSMKLKNVIIPINPGMCSAFGSLIADMRVDKVKTCAMRSDTLNQNDIRKELLGMIKTAKEEIREEGYAREPEIHMVVSMRYLEQNYEQDIPITSDFLKGGSIGECYDLFHKYHKDFYGYNFPENIIELIHLKVTAVGKIEFGGLQKIKGDKIPVQKDKRVVTINNGDNVMCKIYARSGLGSGVIISGPAIIEEPASTTYVGADEELKVDEYGNLIISI